MANNPLRSWMRGVGADGWSSSLATLADQAVVSGTSFAATVLVGRVAGPAELGLYALTITLALFAATAQDAIVTLPYTIFGPRLEGEQRWTYAGSSLWLCAALAALALTIGLAALGLSLWGVLDGDIAPALMLFLAITPTFLMREFARRFLFAEMQATRALQFDASIAALQVAMLAALVINGRLSARTAGLALSGASAVALLSWFWTWRTRFNVVRSEIRPAFARNWAFGGWVLAGRLVGTLNSETLLLWVIAVMVSHAASGTFAACMTIVLFTNPFVLGVSNLVTPRIARAFADGGPAGVRRAVTGATWTIVPPLILFCAGVWWFAGPALHLLYGELYAGQETTVVVLALGALASAAGIGPSNGLWVLGRPRANVASSGISLVITLTTATLLVARYQVLGAALALLVGLGAEASAKTALFHYYLRFAAPESPETAVESLAS